MGAFLVPAMAASCTRPGAPSLHVRTADGFTILAEMHQPDASLERAPLVVLGHQLDRDRRSWDPLVPRLVTAGYAVVQVDHRGFGESTKEAKSPTGLSEEARSNVGLDLLAVLAEAGRRAGVDSTRIAVIGTGMSVPAALRCAREDTDVRAVILLAGMIDLDGEDFLFGHPELPLLMSAAENDSAGMQLMRQYARRFTGPDQVYVEIGATSLESPATWRGTDGLTGDTGLADLLLWFLERHLPASEDADSTGTVPRGASPTSD